MILKMDSEDGGLFIKQLASFVRTHEKALANALQFQRRETRHRNTQSTSSATLAQSQTFPDRPSTASASASSSLAAAFSLGSLNFTSHNVKSAKLALTPHHLFYLLSRFEELGVDVGPMKVRLEDLHDTTAGPYVSFSRNRGADDSSIHSVSSMRSVMSGMSALWTSFGIGASISAARTERQRAALEADMKYLFSAFTKIPCLRLAPDWRARLIRGYEEFPFDSAVPLHVFKNVQALEVSSIDFRQFFGWDRMADQLRSLTLKNAGIEDPADILIDIVLDDMDKRRRRTSKVQASPSIPWGESPRKSPSMSHRELSRSMSAPGSPEPRRTLADLTVGSLTPSEPAIEDGNTSDDSRHTVKRADDTDEGPQSPPNGPRPRSNSPHRPASSRNHSGHVRTHHRIRRSGSASSNSSLSDSWYHHHSRGSSANLLGGMGVLPASKWRFLRHLSLADNSMTSISSTSLAPLSNTLYSLDLSSNLFDQIPDSLATLTALRALNLSHCMINSLNSLGRSPLPAITSLNLRCNKLVSLVGVEKLFPLERLDLRDNQLKDPMELARLTGIPDIREIWLDGNPFTRTHKDYRVIIFTLFRNTPGYTDDIIIDGSGPSYSEKRLLVDRAPLPDSVPVVTFKTAEMPGIHVGKSMGGSCQPREPAVLRKERPVLKAVASETSTTSSRFRGTQKRRIVDVASSEKTSVVVPPKDMQAIPSAQGPTSTLTAVETSYRISQQPETPLLPPIVLAEARKAGNASPEKPRSQPAVDSDHRQLYGAVDSSAQWKDPTDWDGNGEMYRRRIQALRDRVGSGYLSVLGEEGWDTGNAFDPTGVTSVSAFSHAAHHLPPVQAIHSGHP